jgi:heme/copper-type cytochrome/quinol oxidase subunit 2
MMTVLCPKIAAESKDFMVFLLVTMVPIAFAVFFLSFFPVPQSKYQNNASTYVTVSSFHTSFSTHYSLVLSCDAIRTSVIIVT